MVEILFEQNVLWAVLAAVCWGFAARGARRLAVRPPGRIRRRALLGLVLLGFALLVLALRVSLAFALTGAAGWAAGADYVLFAAVPLLPAGLAVLVLSVPAAVRVHRAARGTDPESPEAVAALRALAGDPRLVVPVQATTVACLAGMALTLHPPAPPYTGMFLAELALLAVAAVALLLYRQRRRDALARPGWRRPTRGGRLLRGTAVLATLALGAAGCYSFAAQDSRLADRQGHHAHTHDTGGGPGPGQAPRRSVEEFTGPRDGTPDRTFTLTATDETLRLASGETVDALAFNGRIPGPELRVVRDELVEVVLVNENVEDGVTVHWHGVDVPNAEDGVAGVTQDAVFPGERHVYRFRPDRAGTFWYHSHQQSSLVVARGLFGPMIVEEPGTGTDGLDLTVTAHAWNTGTSGSGDAAGRPRGALSGRNGLGGELRTAFGDSTQLQRHRVAAGTAVRLRLLNADNCPRTFALTGTGFTVAAIDGSDVHGGTELRGERLRVAGGGRMDVTFRQPDGPVGLAVVGDANVHGQEGCGEDGKYGKDVTEPAAVLLAPDQAAELPDPAPGPVFDPLRYGTPADTPFGPDSEFDRDFHMVLGNSFGFYDGRPMVLWTINNQVYPDIPPLLVSEGDLVRVTFVNRSLDDHPMHLHGHRMLVLSRDGSPAGGSPWWTDTLNVAPGDRYQIAFRADNPGIWMDHCHNLDHARDGMVLHLMYDGLHSPYETGRATGNFPE